MSAMPIPFTSIVQYCTIYEVDEFEEFLYIIRLVDNFIVNKESSNGTKTKADKNNNNKS